MPSLRSIGIPEIGLILLPAITGTWTVPFVAYLMYLNQRIVYHRLHNEKWMGDRLESGSDPDPLFLETRAQGNFLENVPMALFFAAVAELNGADRKILNYILAAFLALRIGHVELGLRGKGTLGIGRPIGYYGTQVSLIREYGDEMDS